MVLAPLFCLLVPIHAAAQQGGASQPEPSLPLTGPSVLRSLALTVDMSPLGRLGGEGAPPADGIPALFTSSVRKAFTQAGRDDDAALAALKVPFQVDGATLYRVSCRSCHGVDGTGKPPAVASIIGPSLALSPAHHEERMRVAGGRVRPQMAEQLAQQADLSLRQRLSEGGKKPNLPYLETMPAFAHLSDAEVTALEAYLKELARAPGRPASSPTAPMSAMRIGEHVVRGTCRVCHDGTGPGGGHSLMMAGLVPSLSGLPNQLSLEGVVHKVRHGWNAMAGVAHGVSRMPVFAYLTDEEVAAAYLYLTYLPPESR
jgi:mono/diheme cytochrome c family protein